MIPAPDVTESRMTAEQLFAYHAPDKRTELVRGRLVVREPAGYAHGVIAARMLAKMSAFLELDRVSRGADHPLGDLLAAEPGFTLQRAPDTVRAPDVAFVASRRRPSNARGFAELAPDLAVEVRSPDDRTSDVLLKVADWLNAGSLLVWVIDPERRVAQVYRADGSVAALGEPDAFDGEQVLPGFRCELLGLLG